MWKQLKTSKTNANNITCITRRKVTKLYKLRTNARAFYTKRKFSRRNVCTVESIHSTAIWVRINTGILSSCKVWPCSLHHQSSCSSFQPCQFHGWFRDLWTFSNQEQLPQLHGCLFHLKQPVTRHKAALPAYGANALLRSDFCSFFGLAFVPVADTETCWRLPKNYLLAAYPFA